MENRPGQIQSIYRYTVKGLSPAVGGVYAEVTASGEIARDDKLTLLS
jgi:hypothetical protein